MQSVYGAAAGQVGERREAPSGTCVASLLFLINRMRTWRDRGKLQPHVVTKTMCCRSLMWKRRHLLVSSKAQLLLMLKLLPHGKFSSVCNKVPFSFVAGDSGRTATHKEKDPYRSESVALYETVVCWIIPPCCPLR